MKVEESWRTYNRHYDDLDHHERKRVRQRLALRVLQQEEATPALQTLAAAIQFVGG